ncbi:MAG: hypothetical protein WCK96_16995 [Methylococcales bacterium]
MSIRRYQQTLNHHQDMLLPMRVEEFVSENNNAVRTEKADESTNPYFIIQTLECWNAI